MVVGIPYQTSVAVKRDRREIATNGSISHYVEHTYFVLQSGLVYWPLWSANPESLTSRLVRIDCNMVLCILHGLISSSFSRSYSIFRFWPPAAKIDDGGTRPDDLYKNLPHHLKPNIIYFPYLDRLNSIQLTWYISNMVTYYISMLDILSGYVIHSPLHPPHPRQPNPPHKPPISQSYGMME